MRPVDPRTIDQRFERYRLVQPRAEQLLRSLSDYGQNSPVVVSRLEGCSVLVDGFKRLRAAQILGGFERLAARSWRGSASFAPLEPRPSGSAAIPGGASAETLPDGRGSESQQR